MDYATKFPEAIPLRRVDAVMVAEALVEVFSRLEIPEELIRGPIIFMSTLMSELFEMLKVNHIHTSPYHPHTDGMVEQWHHQSHVEEMLWQP
jgi:hypoxanthine-guanine phosphoribosyltransferase